MNNLMSRFDLQTLARDIKAARVDHNHRTAMMYLRFIAAVGAMTVAALVLLVIVVATS